MNNNFIKGIGLLVIIGLSFLLGKYTNKPVIIGKTEEKIIVDTFTIEKVKADTIMQVKYIERYLPTLPDQQDTIIIRDSVKVYVPINKYLFEEPDKYKIEVSGYDVNIDNIKLFPKTIYKTETQVIKLRPKFGIGLQVGYGICNKTISPYIGVGISYNLITF